MTIAFYTASALAIATAALALTRGNAVHGLLYLVVSLVSTAVVFLSLGAPFIAALEVIIYAGAIVVLFLFAVMVVGLGSHAIAAERQRIRPRVWIVPGILGAALAAELLLVSSRVSGTTTGETVSPSEVGRALLGPYLLGVELASLLLLAGLLGAYHLGRRARRGEEEP